MENSRRLRRRTLIKRASLLVGGVLGLGLAGRASVSTGSSSGALAMGIRGIHWRLTYPDRPRGVLPQPGQRSSVFGELVSNEGTKVGEFYASSLQFGTPFGASDVAADAMETHQFTFSDGTIIGIGTLGDLYGSQSVHAIIGGTGRYEGASGSYVARQRPIELGGDGTADFDFNVMLRSA